MERKAVKIPRIIGQLVLKREYSGFEIFPNDSIERLYDKEYLNYDQLLLDVVMDNLDTEVAILFFLNVLDFDYFYKNKVYLTLNIDYNRVSNCLYYKDYFLKDVCILDFIEHTLEILGKSDLTLRDSTSILMHLSNIPNMNVSEDIRKYILNNTEKYKIKYNKFMLSIYLTEDRINFEDFDSIQNDLTLDWSQSRVTIYSTLFNNFERSLNASPNQLRKLLEDVGLLIYQPKNIEDKHLQMKYINYLSEIYPNGKFDNLLVNNEFEGYFNRISRVFQNNIFYYLLKFDLSDVDKEDILKAYRLFCINTPEFFENKIGKIKLRNIKIKNLKLYFKLRKIRKENLFNPNTIKDVHL